MNRWPRIVLRLSLACSAAFVAAGCGVTEQKRPAPGLVGITIDDSQEVSREGPLHYAVIWTAAAGESTAAIITEDGALNDVAAQGHGIQFVELSVPSADLMSASIPVEPLEMQHGILVGAFRPRVLIYEDTDGNGQLTPAVLGGTGLDRILSIDDGATGPSVAAVMDVEAALAELSLEATATYYEATRDVFTPFVPVESSRGVLGMRVSDAPMVLSLSEGPRPAVELACLRKAVSGSTPALFATSRVDGIVDTALSAQATCGVFFETCESRDFSTEPAPDITPFESDWRFGLAQCRDGGRVQVLVIHRAELECEPCSCRTAAHAEAWIADPASLPGWWPCGEGVPWCDSDLPLYTIDPLCVSDEEED